MKRATWIVLGLAVAGCGDGSETTEPATPAVKADTPAEQPAAVEFAPVTMPENVIGAAAFIEAPEANEGRVAIEGAILEVDDGKARFLLCDRADTNCIAADC
jgi:hypothetical protein